MLGLKQLDGAFVRDEWDIGVQKQVRAYAKLPTNGARVLDVGAHIGLYSLWALAHGAASVVAVEPETANLVVLRLNLGDQIRARVIAAAVIADDREEVPLWLSRTRYTTTHTLQARRGRTSVPVRAIRWSTLLEETQLTLIKMDIEGGEHDLDWVLPRSVNSVGVGIALAQRFTACLSRTHYREY